MTTKIRTKSKSVWLWSFCEYCEAGFPDEEELSAHEQSVHAHVEPTSEDEEEYELPIQEETVASQIIIEEQPEQQQLISSSTSPIPERQDFLQNQHCDFNFMEDDKSNEANGDCSDESLLQEVVELKSEVGTELWNTLNKESGICLQEYDPQDDEHSRIDTNTGANKYENEKNLRLNWNPPDLTQVNYRSEMVMKAAGKRNFCTLCQKSFRPTYFKHHLQLHSESKSHILLFAKFVGKDLGNPRVGMK